MADLVSGLLGVLLATNQAVAASNFVAERTGARIEITDTNNPVEREYLRLLEMDNSAQEEVDRWLLDEEKFATKGAAADKGVLRARIRQRFDPVDKAYTDFLARNPNHSKARIAYGSFLDDIGRENDAREQWEKARQIDPKNPAVWNNLANVYGHSGTVSNAFSHYEKAIELAPNESLYHQNLATTVYLFRRDATNYYGITEQQVFDKAMALYRKALALAPDNFPLATDLAQTYYGIQPPRIKDALEAWSHALKLARDDIEREGVRVHLARWHRTAGDFDAARKEINLVTNEMYSAMKANVLRSIDRKESGVTNAPPDTSK
jgi:tetratricopeptide (TPR) repeat protein